MASPSEQALLRLGPLLRYNALPTVLRGTCLERRANFNNIICNKLTKHCKEQAKRF